MEFDTAVRVSVVIPVFNVEHYLRRCLESILSQSLKDIEIICIDDASTDNSPDILTEYAARETRLQVITFKTNQGVGAARNAGIVAAQGETICFVDPDDLLPAGALEVRFEAYARHGAVVKGQRVDMTPEGQITRRDLYPQQMTEHVFRPASDMRFIELLDHHHAWLFPADLLKKSDIRYKEGMRNAQDLYFLAAAFFHITKMICINSPVYVLVHRQGSATNRQFTMDNYINILRCSEIFYQQSIIHDAIFFGDYYFNKRILHALTRMLEKTKNTQIDNNDFKLFIDYGLYIFNKFYCKKRYDIHNPATLPEGLRILLYLSRENVGGLRYKIYKAIQSLKSQ